MNCREAQLLIAPYVLGDTSLTEYELQGLEAHLATCSGCAGLYEDINGTIEAVRVLPADLAEQICAGNWDVDWEGVDCDIASLGSMAVDTVGQQGKSPLARDSNVSNLHVIIDAESSRPRLISLFRRVGTLAACFVLLLAGMVAYRHLGRLSQPSIFAVVATNPGGGTDHLVMGTVAWFDAAGQPCGIRALTANEALAAACRKQLAPVAPADGDKLESLCRRLEQHGKKVVSVTSESASKEEAECYEVKAKK